MEEPTQEADAPALAASLDPLSRLAIRYGADKYGVHLYTPVYHRFFEPLRERPLRLLEIGVGGYAYTCQGGPSLRMWADYFPHASIVGMDLFPKALELPDRVTVVQGSQSSAEDLDRVWREHGPFDIVIDDGSHRQSDILASFHRLFERLAPGGLYVIEDLHTAFNPAYGGSPDGRGTVMEWLGELSRDMHDREIAVIEPGRTPSRYGSMISGIHLHYNIAVIERGVNDFPSIFGFNTDEPGTRAVLADVAAQLSAEPTQGAYSGLASLHSEAGDKAEALRIAQEGLEQFPDSVMLLHAAQAFAAACAPDEERLQLLDRLTELCPPDALYPVLAVFSLLGQGEELEARRRAGRIDPAAALEALDRYETMQPWTRASHNALRALFAGGGRVSTPLTEARGAATPRPMTDRDPLSETDVFRGFELALGREPESPEALQDKKRFNRTDFLKVLFTSGEFLAKTYEQVIRGEPIAGGLFDTPPSEALRAWAAAFCPLSDSGRARVLAAASWYGLFHALLSDPLLAGAVFEEKDPARSRAFLAALAAGHAKAQASMGEIRGAVDIVANQDIRGWALDTRDPDRVLELELHLDGVFAGAASTDAFRLDIQEIYGGDGRRGFVIGRRPGDTPEGATVAAEVREAASGTVIGSFQLQPGLAPPLDEASAVRRELAELRGVLDRIEARLPAFGAAFGFSLGAYEAYFRTYYGPVLAAARGRGRNHPPADIAVILYSVAATPSELDAALASIADQSVLPRELVVVHPGGSEALKVGELLAEWRARLPDLVQLSDVATAETGWAGALNTAVERTLSERLLFFPARCDLSPRAVEVLSASLESGAALAYADDDRIEVDGRGGVVRRSDPRLRTAFDRDLLLQTNALGSLLGVSRGAFVQTGGFRDAYDGAGVYDLSLRLIETVAPEAIAHASEVLAHRRSHLDEATDPAPDLAARTASLRDHLARVEPDAQVEPHSNILGPALPGALRVRRPARLASASAAIIVPARDRLDLLGPCIASLLAARSENQVRTEILVVDDKSTAAATRAFLGSFSAASGPRVIEHEGAFNRSLMNNRAAAETDAEVLIFLNNDTVVLARDWCDELVQHALRPEVGAVGARLLYEDGTIQHAGVVVGGTYSFAAHEGVWQPGAAPGYLGRHALVRRVSAVTGACLATRAEVFNQLGGFDHVAFAQEANDIDYCFRLREAGLAVIYNPYATLYHLQSKSRGLDTDAEKQRRAARSAEVLRDRWEARFGNDPFYNPHFDRLSPPLTRLHPPPNLSKT